MSTQARATNPSPADGTSQDLHTDHRAGEADPTKDPVGEFMQMIERNPGLAVVGAVAVGAVIACAVMPSRNSRQASEFAKLQRKAIRYGSHLERRARRELRKVGAEQHLADVNSSLSSVSANQIMSFIAPILTSAQQFYDQARDRVTASVRG